MGNLPVNSNGTQDEADFSKDAQAHLDAMISGQTTSPKAFFQHTEALPNEVPAIPAPTVAPLTQQQADLSGNQATDVGTTNLASGINATNNTAANAGTGVAINAVQMKNPSKTNKVAESDVKVLPVGENNGGHEKNLPVQRPVTAVRATDNRAGDFNFAFSNNGTPTAARPADVAVLDLPSLADARMRGVERTHDMIALHAMRLLESKSDTLAVLIKPTVGTELALELRQHATGVEVQATVTRGDHQFLSQHWTELQQRLEQRGIKLAPLGSEASMAANDGGQFQRQQTSQEEAAQQASAFAEFASISPGGASARLGAMPAPHEGWESWA